MVILMMLRLRSLVKEGQTHISWSLCFFKAIWMFLVARRSLSPNPQSQLRCSAASQMSGGKMCDAVQPWGYDAICLSEKHFLSKHVM